MGYSSFEQANVADLEKRRARLDCPEGLPTPVAIGFMLLLTPATAIPSLPSEGRVEYPTFRKDATFDFLSLPFPGDSTQHLQNAALRSVRPCPLRTGLRPKRDGTYSFGTGASDGHVAFHIHQRR